MVVLECLEWLFGLVSRRANVLQPASPSGAHVSPPAGAPASLPGAPSLWVQLPACQHAARDQAMPPAESAPNAPASAAATDTQQQYNAPRCASRGLASARLRRQWLTALSSGLCAGRRLNLCVADFDILGRLGEGSFSTVILARHK